MRDVRERIEALWRDESRRVLATLARLLGDLELAEDALHEAFAAALERWPREGVPASPRAWLVSTGRFRAVDALRRRARFDASLGELARRVERDARDASRSGAAREPDEPAALVDDRLRLVFLCCHPSLSDEARIALTLREVCGLTTEEIARAFLTSASTLAQRIVRAKARLRDERVAFELPGPDALPERLDAVLRTIYLVFNEGYLATSGEMLVRADLSSEATRLARLLVELCPEPEAEGLLALVLLHESRRAARSTAAGEIVLLDDQDRALWDRALASEGCARVERALRSRRFGPYTLQAAIAAVHAEAQDAASTDWAQIVGLYDVLLRAEPSPVIALNRALAVARRDGDAAGLEIVDALLARGELDGYHLAYAARADLCRRLGRVAEARAAYARALELVRQGPERRFLERRMRESGG
ncbi:MAG: RNA polymerase sigma factor [Planctomycetes bacterium]|nr:RNA polymerase sigma factor [Planctomycetota bacterium]